MTLKNKAALQYLLPLLLIYAGAIAALASDELPTIESLIGAALPASAMLAVCHLLQDAIPKAFKETLIFWRISDRLPGHRSFTDHCKGDPRIPADFIARTLEAVRQEATTQNAKWYGLYLTVAKHPQVEHENLRYLAWRDATSTLLLLAVGTLALPLLNVVSWRHAGWVAAACIGLGAVTLLAARNAAYSLVRNTVAVAASGGKPVPME